MRVSDAKEVRDVAFKLGYASLEPETEALETVRVEIIIEEVKITAMMQLAEFHRIAAINFVSTSVMLYWDKEVQKIEPPYEDERFRTVMLQVGSNSPSILFISWAELRALCIFMVSLNNFDE